MLSRRSFLNRVGAAGAGCLSVGRIAPNFWSQIAAAAEQQNSSRRLIVVELTGGNDGLNTVVPYGDDAYYRARPTLGIAKDKVLKLDEHLGLHPAMKTWQPLWDQGELAIIENCGYPQPNRSHFESMAIWHAGQLEPGMTGWLGRSADEAGAGEACFVGEGSVPLALTRRHATVASLASLGDLKLLEPAAKAIAERPAESGDLAELFDAQLAGAKRLSDSLAGPQGTTLPAAPLAMQMLDTAARNSGRENSLAVNLAVVRALLEREQPFRVYYTALDGFDTHADQKGTHESLLKRASEAISGFLAELKRRKLDRGVSVFVFSEFGRRLHENGSQGTDHGAAAPTFLLGDGVRGGLHGGRPDLSDLDDGDVRYKTDFRDLYGAVLRGGLGIDPATALGNRPPGLELFG